MLLEETAEAAESAALDAVATSWRTAALPLSSLAVAVVTDPPVSFGFIRREREHAVCKYTKECT